MPVLLPFFAKPCYCTGIACLALHCFLSPSWLLNQCCIRLSEPSNWLRATPRATEDDVLVCNNTAVNCRPEERWNRPPAAPYGAHQPAWKFGPPEFNMFNLCEPFGEGNVVSELLFEGSRSTGSYGSATPRLFEYLGDGSTKHLTFFGRDCDPHTTQLRPAEGSPTFG